MNDRKQTNTPWAQRKRSRQLRKGPLLILLLIVAVASVGGFWHWKRSLLYQPLKTLGKSPAMVELDFEPVEFQSPPKTKLKGWFIPAAATENSKTDGKAIVYCHGFDGNMGERLRGSDGGTPQRLQKLKMFHTLGLDVLAFDYRGYGESSGWPTEQGLYLDAFAAYFYLMDERGIASTNIYFYGEGLGASVALAVSSRGKGAGVIIEGAPVSAHQWLLETRGKLPWDRLPIDKFDATARIGKLRMPLLMLHSEDDELVSYKNAEALFKQAKDPKELVKVYGSHGNAFITSFDTYHDAIRKFVGLEPLTTDAADEKPSASESAADLKMRVSVPEPVGAP
jgi:fermentation-respiration switch protein FrsA (DUF1100 family)